MDKHLQVLVLSDVCWKTNHCHFFSIAIVAFAQSQVKFCFLLGFPVTHVLPNVSFLCAHPVKPGPWNAQPQLTYPQAPVGYTSLAMSAEPCLEYWLKSAPSPRRLRMGKSFLLMSMCSLASSPELPKSNIPRWWAWPSFMKERSVLAPARKLKNSPATYNT